MRIAVVGGTGLVGRHPVEALGRSGYEVVVLARSQGVDVVTGDGLGEALDGVEVVIDVTSTAETEPAAARDFFGAATGQLLAAEQRAGVGHHVLLSIVGVDRAEGNGHYAGKLRQEELVQTGSVPYTILRATQFHNFAAIVVGWTRHGDVALVPPLLVQPVAVADVAEALAEIATGAPQGWTTELAGPEPQDLVDMARRTLAARGDKVRLIPSWHVGPLSVGMAGEVLLPGPDARFAPTTFDAWLSSEAATTPL